MKQRDKKPPVSDALPCPAQELMLHGSRWEEYPDGVTVNVVSFGQVAQVQFGGAWFTLGELCLCL